MVQVVKLKRSAVAGKVPTAADLDYGEIALNTADGRIFLKKNDGAEAIVQIKNSADVVPGDIILSGNPDYTIPSWIPADGSTYETGVYPKIEPIFGTPGSGFTAPTYASPDPRLTYYIRTGE